MGGRKRRAANPCTDGRGGGGGNGEDEVTRGLRWGGECVVVVVHPRMNYPTRLWAAVKGKRGEGSGPLSGV